jgi:hypothetical protein
MNLDLSLRGARPSHESPAAAAARSELRAPDIVSEHQEALAAGDVEAIVAAFEPEGYAREPAGGQHRHTGLDGLRYFYQLLFSNDGGIPLEQCALIDDKGVCALEYNVVRWGRTELSPEAGVAVYARGQSGNSPRYAYTMTSTPRLLCK